ncbi:hypothetical protein KAFR_0C02310 [Kazachstania africana CBS 2517]|uniref:Conserved oligomeric Golgi complex subunit 2 C-terminal domain-containing protein n=1 Tax=Kazachstania africana (strain ATCC 22294 / BCRC 22015 / CBS 2517 / CECT 1963 / NBRC 1671 / NRRL Y-8276) TaxID=1071382 RepID=H2AS74_KAZAF|nr:hypothetical protein KAFR_0C02310 [Kazachstania africana CBS 2517]CCF57224.1 hypothetical protein KAFR_0C02310 [Kazachstania africana CBS 2517]
MDFLSDEEMDLELPTTTDITRGLFGDQVDKLHGEAKENEKGFNVDEFLMQNNFHYLPLDSLIRDLSNLSIEIVQALLGQVTDNYDNYLAFFSTYSKDENETLLELQKTRAELNSFMTHLGQLTKDDLSNTRETIEDSVEYLKNLDCISEQLNDHKRLADEISLSKKLSNTLHKMCAMEDIQEQLCGELIKKLFQIINSCRGLLTSLESLNSPFIHHIRNEYQGLVQEFQVSLKILTDLCLEDTKRYKYLNNVLISLLAKDI